MKYVVGQQLRIRPDLAQYTEAPFGVNSNMEKLAGQIVTIRSSRKLGDDDCYNIKEDGGIWSWSIPMFAPVEMSVDEAFELVLKGGLTDEQYEKIRRERG